ncbi:putative ATPase [Trypanosoma theileri]|uniref:Putative ATPase n=1 Tax=Trypanosoma theileri TaxID=67003 RepID=A0A1X0NZ99_9TRYP|nr:putative ATPase [Trypanosoma theileri]ORC89813.1 putative ATPase [Trypanosoma theileri]
MEDTVSLQRRPTSPFEFAVELLCGIALHWPHCRQPASVLLCGPCGNGKSHVVRSAVRRARRVGSRRVLNITPRLAESLARRKVNGSTMLRKEIRHTIADILLEQTESGVKDKTELNTESVVIVILDHMELFLTATTDTSSFLREEGTSSGYSGSGTPHHPALLADLYDIIRGRDLFQQEELQQMRLSCVLFVTLFSGVYEEVDLFARDKLFDAYVSLKTPTESERLTFMQNQSVISPLLCRAIAARSGGVTYRGLTEILRHVEEIIHEKSSDKDYLEFLSPIDNFNTLNKLYYKKFEDFAASLALQTIRLFSASGSTAAQEYRESAGYIDVQETHWSDIAGLEKVKKTLQRLILRPLKHYTTYRRFGVRPSTGVLLSGPPGTGKTMLARAMATELNASFIYMDLPQLIQSEVGESERKLREFFDVARERSPSVMFIDELQAAFGNRYDAEGRSSSTHDARLVSQLLHLLDKAHEDEDHFTLFVGATNVKHMLDEALLRAGRLDTIVEVPLPDEAARHSLVQRVVYGEWNAWFPNSSTSVDTDAVRQALIKAFVEGTTDLTGAEMRHTINVFALHFLRLIHIKKEALCEPQKLVDSVHSLQELLIDAKSHCMSGEAQMALTRALSKPMSST